VIICFCHKLQKSRNGGSQVIVSYIKVKVKLPLCLTKSHTMKTYPMLNQAPFLEDLWNVAV